MPTIVGRLTWLQRPSTKWFLAGSTAFLGTAYPLSTPGQFVIILVCVVLILTLAVFLILPRRLVRECESRRRVADSKRFARFVAAWSVQPPFGIQVSGVVDGLFILSGIGSVLILGISALGVFTGKAVGLDADIALMLTVLLIVFSGTGWVLFLRRRIRHVAGRNIGIDDIRALWDIDDQA